MEEEVFWIKPATPVPAQKTLLPPCDQIGITIIIPRLLCYTIDPSLSEAAFLAALKTAIAGTIAEYPHLCGKISWADEATKRVQLDIEENPTVQLKVKRLPNFKSAEELDKDGWPMHEFQREVVSLSKYPTYGINSYNFAVQANMIPGGVLLGTHMNHVHLDGIPHALIEILLAHHLSRALDGKKPRPSGLVTPQVLDKSLAKPKHPARPILEWEDWRKAPPPMKIEGLSEQEVIDLYMSTLEDFTLSVWKITPEAQQQIRRIGQDPTGKGKKLSFASCLHSWLWRVYVKAREHDPDTPTICLTPIQTRGRVKELPQWWSGSALVYSRAKSTSTEVLEGPLYELGRRIDAGIDRWTPDAVREFWGSIEDCKNLHDIEPNVHRQNGTDVEFSNLSNFPFFSLHWGKGLNVKSWRGPALAFTDAYVLIVPRLPNGDLEIMMLFTKDALENALKDPEWRKYAQYVSSGEVETDAKIKAATLPASARL